MSKPKLKKEPPKKTESREDCEPEELSRAPHCFVIHRGEVSSHVLELSRDFRKVMEPFTASSLRERRYNTMRDYVSVAGVLHVTHMCIFTQTTEGVYMKVAGLPRGPTLTFRVHSYSLISDVLSLLKKQLVMEKQLQHSPLLVMNSFGGEGMHMKLMATLFQNMFPSINLLKVVLDDLNRCVLMNYNPTTKLIDFRHYAIKVVPVGLSRGVKKIVLRRVPDLSKFEDVADYIIKSEVLSESEGEDDPSSHVTLPQSLRSGGNLKGNKSAVRLVELGPRLTLQLLKVEEGLVSGEVLYHDLYEKTMEEKKLILERREARRKLREQRTRTQEENKKKKELLKAQLKQKALEGMKKKSESERMVERAVKDSHEAIHRNMEEDDDADWYRKEVGEEPDKDLFAKKTSGGLKRTNSEEYIESKKQKTDTSDEEEEDKKGKGHKFRKNPLQLNAKKKKKKKKMKGKSKGKGKKPKRRRRK